MDGLTRITTECPMIKWKKRERKEEIERSKGLGYGAKAPEYEALNTDIATLENSSRAMPTPAQYSPNSRTNCLGS